jgi:hypothetical protein
MVAVAGVVVDENEPTAPDTDPSNTSVALKIPTTLKTCNKDELCDVTTTAVAGVVVDIKVAVWPHIPVSAAIFSPLVNVPATVLTTSSVLLVCDTTTAVAGTVLDVYEPTAPVDDPSITSLPLKLPTTLYTISSVPDEAVTTLAVAGVVVLE